MYERFFSRDLIERAVRDYSVYRRVADIAQIIVKRSVYGYVCHDKSDHVFNDTRLDSLNPFGHVVSRDIEQIVYDIFRRLRSVNPKSDIFVVRNLVAYQIDKVAYSDFAEYS